MKAGTAGIVDYELVKLLLTQAIPHGDVKCRAKELIDEVKGL